MGIICQTNTRYYFKSTQNLCCPSNVNWKASTLHHVKFLMSDFEVHNAEIELWNSVVCASVTCTGLTHWYLVTHKCVCKPTIIASNNGLSPGRRLALIWTNVGIMFIETLGTNFSEILCQSIIFSFAKYTLKCRMRNGSKFASPPMC